MQYRQRSNRLLVQESVYDEFAAMPLKGTRGYDSENLIPCNSVFRRGIG